MIVDKSAFAAKCYVSMLSAARNIETIAYITATDAIAAEVKVCGSVVLCNCIG